MSRSQPDQPSVARLLLGCLDARCILRCAIDRPDEGFTTATELGHASVDVCEPENLASHLASTEKSYDALWLTGHATWHGLRGLQEIVTSAIEARRHDAARPLILLLEGPPPEGPPAWSTPEALAAHFVRADAIKEGGRIGLESLVEGQGYIVVWFSSGAGAGLAVPEQLWRELGPLAAMLRTLADELRVEQRRAAAALALAYESQTEVVAQAAPPAPTINGDALVAQYLAAGGLVDNELEALRLVCSDDGSWFLVEGKVRRYIASGVIVQALLRALGGPVPMSADDLESYEEAAPLVVVTSPDDRAYLVVAGTRIALRGFPRVVPATQRAISRIKISKTVNVNEMQFPRANGVSQQRPAEPANSSWMSRALTRALTVSQALAASRVARRRDDGD